MQLLLWFELGTLVICLLHFGKIKKDPALQYFFVLLILTNIVEMGSAFRLFTIHLQDGRRTSNWIYNIFNPIEFGFFTYYYYHLLDSRKEKRKTILLYGLLLFLVLINIGFVQGWIFMDSYTYILGCAMLVYFSVSWFRQVSEKVDNINILTVPHFWINVGVLLFYAGEFFLFIFFEYFLRTNSFKEFLPVWSFFSNFLNVILYTCLSIAFFCRPRQQEILL